MTRHSLAGAFVAACLATSALAQDLAGTYTAQGRNSDGSPYSGTVALTEIGRAYRLDWKIGQQSYTGIGVRDGRVLQVDWDGQQPPVVYVLMPGGALHGTWADGTALEKLTPR